MLRRSGAHLRRNLVAYVALFVALGGSASAATSLFGSGGTLRACAVKSSGSLRLVKPRAKCHKGETAVSWNQRGPSGPQGIAGASGAAGADGQPGQPGSIGQPGSPAASFLTGSYIGRAGYASPVGLTADNTQGESAVSMLSPAATVVARDLAVHAETSQVGDNMVTLRVNGADTALQCSIAQSSTSLACTDTTHAVTIPPGSTLSIRSTLTGGGSGGAGAPPLVRFGWRATTP